MKKLLFACLVLVVGLAPAFAAAQSSGPAGGAAAGPGSGSTAPGSSGAGAPGMGSPSTPSTGDTTSGPSTRPPSASPSMDPASQFKTEQECVSAGGKWQNATQRCSITK